MALNLDFIITLYELLDRSYFDERAFNRFIITKGLRGFIEHENAMGRNVDIKDIKDELKRLMEYESYEDRYCFYILKRNLHGLKRDIYYLMSNGEEIVKSALERIFRVISADVEIKTDIYLYAGGPDGGFTVNRNEVYINYLNYIGEKDELIKILSHELYHSRKIRLIRKLKFGMKLLRKRKRYAYGLLGRIIEEGIASFIQHGPILTRDDKTGNLTRRNLTLSRKHFDMLNESLINIKHGRFNRVKLYSLNVYAIGYIMVSAIHNEGKLNLLNQWTENLDFKGIIAEYMKIKRSNKTLPEIKDEAIEWILY